jgi:hypothetical protein
MGWGSVSPLIIGYFSEITERRENGKKERRKRTEKRAIVSLIYNPTLALTHTWGGNWPT